MVLPNFELEANETASAVLHPELTVVKHLVVDKEKKKFKCSISDKIVKQSLLMIECLFFACVITSLTNLLPLLAWEQSQIP